jgi:Na+-driven multidrug efflux pump
MPNALDSLAVLPVIIGLTFLPRSTGVAFSEVVIAHLETRGSARTLRRFAFGLMSATTAGMLLVEATPLSRIWFGTITGLPDNLIDLARTGLWFALLLPALSAVQSWFQGIVLHSRRTRTISEAVLVYLFASTGILIAGVQWGTIAGAYVGLLAMTLGELARAGWLGWRCRRARHALWERDSGSHDAPVTEPR